LDKLCTEGNISDFDGVFLLRFRKFGVCTLEIADLGHGIKKDTNNPPNTPPVNNMTRDLKYLVHCEPALASNIN
jgi:hypothetical protein